MGLAGLCHEHQSCLYLPPFLCLPLALIEGRLKVERLEGEHSGLVRRLLLEDADLGGLFAEGQERENGGHNRPGAEHPG